MKRNTRSRKWTAQQRVKYAATMAARRANGHGRPINGVIVGPDASPDPEIGRMLQTLRLIRTLSDPARNYVLSRAAEGEGVD